MNITDTLKKLYGLTASAVQPANGGFSTKAAFRIDSAEGACYFLKVYDNRRPTTRFFVERIETYMPVLDCLSTSDALRGRVLTPVRALDGSYKVEMESETYVVFRFVEGTVPGIEGMSQEQTIELAEILALLHESTVESTDKYPGLNEDISLPFCLRLQEYLQQPHPGATELSDVVLPHTQTLQQAIETALLLRDRHRTNCDKLVFCHGDAHGNNVIQSDRLVLVDWEDLRLAPVEADLFIYAWHPFGNVLLQAYSHARKGYQVNSELLHFYVLRRRLEDLWVDIQRFTEESPSQEEKTTLLRWIEIGLGKVISLV